MLCSIDGIFFQLKIIERLRFSLFICTVQDIIVEAKTVLYACTAECIEDHTEKNCTRDYFTDYAVYKQSVINSSHNTIS